MTSYNGKNAFECDITAGNKYRREYVESMQKWIDKRYAGCGENRDDFMRDIVKNQEDYRQKFLKMIGEPVFPYPADIPNAKLEHIGKDDFGDIYFLQVETMPDFWFFGVLMVPYDANNAPLVIAQHGGGSTPEICSEFLGVSNYSCFTKRALEKGMVVFAPQLLLWKFDTDTGEKKFDTGISFDRLELDSKLKQIGLSITGLEVFCIRRSIDYLSSLDFVDDNRIGMMGLSYGGYFSLYTAAADTRIKSIYAGAFFNDRERVAFLDWRYKTSANTFCDAEVAALCAPRILYIDVGKDDQLFDWETSVPEAKRAETYYEKFGATGNFRFNLWYGGHRFDENGEGFDFFFDGI